MIAHASAEIFIANEATNYHIILQTLILDIINFQLEHTLANIIILRFFELLFALILPALTLPTYFSARI